MTHKLLAGLASACLLATSLGACSTLNGPLGAGNTNANLAAIQSSLDKFNGAVAANCSGNLDFTQILPMPPTLGVHIQCAPHTPAANAAIQAAATPVGQTPAATVAPK